MSEKKPNMLTVREVSERTGAAIPTVSLWCRSGKLEGARQDTTPYGDYWLIPETSLDGLVVRGRGRPPKPSSTEKPATRKPSASNGGSVRKSGKTTPTPSDPNIQTSKEVLLKAAGKKKGKK